MLSLKQIAPALHRPPPRRHPRRTRFDLEKAQERAHILEGLKIALDHLDEVIATIRGAADAEAARTDLQAKFELTDRRRRRSSTCTCAAWHALEREKIEQEYKEVIKLIAYLEAILANPTRRSGC